LESPGFLTERLVAMGLYDTARVRGSELFTGLNHPPLPEPEGEPRIVLIVGESCPEYYISVWPKSAAVALLRQFSWIIPLRPLKTTVMALQTREIECFRKRSSPCPRKVLFQFPATHADVCPFPAAVSNSNRSGRLCSNRTSLQVLASLYFSIQFRYIALPSTQCL
jgi:hypothetical protein